MSHEPSTEFPVLNLLDERQLDRLRHARRVATGNSHVNPDEIDREMTRALNRARNLRYHREVQVLLALVSGNVPGVEVGYWGPVTVTDGYDRWYWCSITPEQAEEILFQCDGGTITCQRDNPGGESDRVTFKVLFGNGPGELLADWSYNTDDAGAFGELIGRWHESLTENA